MARRVVARPRPGERVEEVEPARVAPLHLDLQRVVVALAAVERRLDELIALDRPARLERRVLAGGVGPRLVVVAEDHRGCGCGCRRRRRRRAGCSAARAAP